MPSNNRVLFCRCATHGVGSTAVRSAVLDGLRGRGIPFTEVDDLCRLAADRDAGFLSLAASADTLTIVACHPRAVRWLLSSAGIATDGDRLRVLDLRVTPAAAIVDQAPGDATPSSPATPAANDAWPPWFPVIDFTRCRHCRQCLSFCLFGVYALTPEGKVSVTNPRSCKNNCPACARICPEVAIMFPKLPDAEAPLNGTEIGDEKEFKARARINAHELLGDDPYATLAERQRQARGRRLLKSAQERAEAERAACAGKNAAGAMPIVNNSPANAARGDARPPEIQDAANSVEGERPREPVTGPSNFRPEDMT